MNKPITLGTLIVFTATWDFIIFPAVYAIVKRFFDE
jgi:hypothetical protein